MAWLVGDTYRGGLLVRIRSPNRVLVHVTKFSAVYRASYVCCRRVFFWLSVCLSVTSQISEKNG